jgi:hypothetical protein
MGLTNIAHAIDAGHEVDRWVDVGSWQLTYDT